MPRIIRKTRRRRLSRFLSYNPHQVPTWEGGSNPFINPYQTPYFDPETADLAGRIGFPPVGGEPYGGFDPYPTPYPLEPEIIPGWEGEGDLEDPTNPDPDLHDPDEDDDDDDDDDDDPVHIVSPDQIPASGLLPVSLAAVPLDPVPLDPEAAIATPVDPLPEAWSAPTFTMPADADPLAFEEAWNRLSSSTREAYQRELLRMAEFLHWPAQEPAEVLRSLAALGKVGASNAIRAYRDFGQVAPATRARRVAAVSKLLRSLHQAGIVDWVPTALAPQVHSVKSREGPPPAAVEKMLVVLASYSDRVAIRDLAMLTLLYDSAMRRSELVSIRVGDWNPQQRTVKVIAKGKEHHDRVVVALSARATTALERWLSVRPGLALAEHPMFAGDVPSERLSTSTVARVCAERGKLGGIVHLRPHGLRHTAATVAAQSGAPSHQLAAYLRHADPKTSQRYIDDLGTQTRALTDLVGSGGSAGVGAARPVAVPSVSTRTSPSRPSRLTGPEDDDIPF